MITEKNINTPFIRELSFREALSYDLVSFLVGLMFLFAVACLILLIVAVAWFGVRPPRETPVEILLDYLLISGVVVAVLRLRIYCLTETLRHGELVAAEVLRSLQHQYFVVILVSYAFHGKMIRKRLWLPNTKYPRALMTEKRLHLSVKAEGRCHAVVRNLYFR